MNIKSSGDSILKEKYIVNKFRFTGDIMVVAAEIDIC